MALNNVNTGAGGLSPALISAYAAVARRFVTALNGSMLYGCEHPNTVKNADALCEAIGAALSYRESITVISNNGSLIIEDWPLDRSFNIAKLLRHFDQIGLISVTFERGVTPGALMRFIGLAGDVNRVEACRDGILDAKERGLADKIRVNYVLYGKIRADEVVVRDSRDVRAAADGARAVSAMAAALPEASNAAAEIEEVLTLSSLLEKPKAISDILTKSDTAALPVGELQDAFENIKKEIDDSAAPDAGKLLESLYVLKKDLYEAIDVQKATGKMMRAAAVVNNELNDLTAGAIVKLVKEEYRSGKTPLNRLAHTIRRMIPSGAELMHILPRLKDMLLSEGMPLSGYLELVKSLGLKIESEDLSESLKDAADSMGASVGDLVAAIKSKPEESARLILLAAEIRQNLGDGEADKLPAMLTGYIEDICSKIAADSCAAEGAGGAALKKILADLETQMLGQLSKQGVSKSVLDNVKTALSSRAGNIGAAADESGAKPRKLKMPAGALSANNLLFLINKEIKRNLRYNTRFSTITVSIDRIMDAGGVRVPSAEDMIELIPRLFEVVEAQLRDVDFIGIIGADTNPELFIVLPMTDGEGTEIVRERIAAKTAAAVFKVADKNVRAATRVSSTCPNEKTVDLKSYLALSRENHNGNCYGRSPTPPPANHLMRSCGGSNGGAF